MNNPPPLVRADTNRAQRNAFFLFLQRASCFFVRKTEHLQKSVEPRGKRNVIEGSLNYPDEMSREKRRHRLKSRKKSSEGAARGRCGYSQLRSTVCKRTLTALAGTRSGDKGAHHHLGGLIAGAALLVGQAFVVPLFYHSQGRRSSSTTQRLSLGSFDNGSSNPKSDVWPLWE